ncbi:Beige/BEACH domain containing protein [Histomonas meleagridis]|uniref:Beige/BEACH domain containing protein n=1 Tax=Histomonas meleagridis TaxID=135588 RepID=UPI0035594A22|nr:Beige/BEACH domain containing protein [Histomonas meleagridis]KAH0801263.1 Beige/BEACH domain containing protein [Histomonas meleagridis]
MNGNISNYEYIYWLNMLSGRSFHDLSQYPIYPWVIQDYDNKVLDFYDKSIYRDLSKPIGALNEDRLRSLRELYDDSRDSPFSCLYRFHYSAPAYVISFLIRKEPFTTLHIQLQKGKFDNPNRLFTGIRSTWNSIYNALNDFRELIPEFYSTPEFLINEDNYDLGNYYNSDGVTQPVGDVALPKWAKSHLSYIVMNRIALESRYVSEHLNEWIDLIFGCKQDLIEYNNLFHPYSNSISITQEPDSIPTIQQHAANFGITPNKLFNTSHPQRQFKPPFSLLLHNANALTLQHKTLKKFEKMPIKIKTNENGFDILLNDGKFVSYVFENDNIELLKDPQTILTMQVPNERIILGTNYKKESYVLFSEPYSHTFWRISKTKKYESSKQHLTAISIIVADKDFCITGSDDSSIIVWNLDSGIPISLIVAHIYPIAALAVSMMLQVVVSCDTNGNFVISSLKNGEFLHKSKINEVPKSILISNLGIYILLFDVYHEMNNKTKIMLVDMSCRIIKEIEINGISTAAKIIENFDASAFLVIAQDDGKIHILRAYDLETIFWLRVEHKVLDFAYSMNDLKLYFIMDDNSINTCSFLDVSRNK